MYCTVLLPPAVNPFAVNYLHIYIYIYIYIYVELQQFLASFAEELNLLTEVNVGLYTDWQTWSIEVQKECSHNKRLIA